MSMSRRKMTVMSVVVDVLIMCALLVLCLLSLFNKLGLRPFRRGFFCNDETISYPYHPDTVTNTVLIVVSIVVPVVMMLIIEALNLIGTKPTCMSYVIALYQTIGPFLLASLLNVILTEVTKNLAGRLRPHFLPLCDPDFSQIHCADGYVEISDDMCRSENHSKLVTARKSFPSGHTSTSACGLLYLMIYLHVRFTWKKASRLFVPLLQCVMAGVAIFFSVSRVSDNKHHATDVIGGAILGVVVCLLVVKYHSPLLRRKSKEKSLEIPQLTGQISSISSGDATINPHVALEMDNKYM